LDHVHLESPMAVLLAVCSTAYGFPARHPVPIEKDIDEAKCLECHENKTKEINSCGGDESNCFA
jgi:hypothetical protein